MSNFLTALTLFSLTASGIVGGTFFIFSTTIMHVLGARPARDSIEVMNRIDEVIVRTSFIAIFLGNAVTASILIGAGFYDLDRPGVWLTIAGATIYFIGSFIVTIAFNVPLNNALAAADPVSPEGQRIWTNYLSNWTRWNHVRTAACIVSTAMLAGSLLYH